MVQTAEEVGPLVRGGTWKTGSHSAFCEKASAPLPPPTPLQRLGRRGSEDPRAQPASSRHSQGTSIPHSLPSVSG